MAEGLFLTTFGVVRLEHGDGRLMPMSPQQLALISIVALDTHPSRDEVATILWPDRSKERARHSLSQTIYAINKKCGDLIGEPSANSLGLNRLALRTDFESIRRQLHAAGAERRQPEIDPTALLSSLQTYPSDTFDEWRQHQIAKLRAWMRQSRRETRSGRPPRSREEDRPSTSSGSTFVGRSAELSIIRRLWNDCTTGATSLVIIAGPSGIGKSFFCRRARRLIAISGGKSLLSHCSTANDITTFAIPRSFLRDQVVEPRDSYDTLARSYVDRTLRLCESPLALIIEDTQHVDDGSALWLELLLRSADDTPLMVIVTVNTDDKHDRDRIARLVASAGVGATWLELRPLSDVESRTLVRNEEASSGKQLASSVRETVLATAQGHPLFLSELTREALLHSAESHELDALREELYTQTVDSVLRQRIGRLSHGAQRVCAGLAVIGRCNLSELCTLMDCEIDLGRAALAELMDFDLIECSGESIELNHDLLRIAAEKMLRPPDRVKLHERAAGVLHQRPMEDAGRIARHYHRAGRLKEAHEFAMVAAKRADSAGNIAAGLRNLALAEMAAPQEIDRCNALVERARVYCILGRFEDAYSVLEPIEHVLKGTTSTLGSDLFALSRTINALERGTIPVSMAVERLGHLMDGIRLYRDDRLVVHVTRYLLTAAHDSGHAPIVRWIIDEMQSGSLVESQNASARIYILAANAEAVYGCAESAHALLQQAVEAGAGTDGGLEIAYLSVRGIVYLVQGNLSQAIEDLEMALRKTSHSAQPTGSERILTNLAAVQLEIGDLDAAYESIKRALGVATNHERLAVIANQAAWCVHARRFDMLIDVIGDLEQANRLLGVKWVETVCETFRGFWYLHHGYLSRACEIADGLAEALPSNRRDLTDRSYSEIAIARAWSACGRVQEAASRLRGLLNELPVAQWACRLRLQAELASLLFRVEPSEARRLATEVRAVAKKNGAYSHLRRVGE